MQCSSCREVIRPIVAIDIDGTMGRYHEGLQEHLQQYVGRTLPSGWDGTGDWEDFLGLSRKEYEDGKLSYRQGGNKRWMEPFGNPGLVTEQLETLGIEIWVTTTRPYLRLDSVDPDTREWLRRNQVSYHHFMYDDDKYGRLYDLVGSDRVVAILEDLPEQYEEAAAYFGILTPILIQRPHNLAFRELKSPACQAGSLEQAQAMIEERVKIWSSR